jgi:hypothetical protein
MASVKIVSVGQLVDLIRKTMPSGNLTNWDLDSGKSTVMFNWGGDRFKITFDLQVANWVPDSHPTGQGKLFKNGTAILLEELLKLRIKE